MARVFLLKPQNRIVQSRELFICARDLFISMRELFIGACDQLVILG